MNKMAIIFALSVVGALMVSSSLLSSTSPASLPAHIETAFKQWAAVNGRSYASPAEQNFRKGVFYRRYQEVQQFNRDFEHRSELNLFADMTPEEVAPSYEYRATHSSPVPQPVVNKTTAPNQQSLYINWVTLGAVIPIQDQGQCGSSPDFASTDSMTGAWQIAKNQLLTLATQQLVDCDTQSSGCNGGLMIYNFEYVIKAGGIMLSSDYPYTAQTGTCKFNKSKVAATISSYQVINQGDCAGMLQQLQKGPIAIAMNASQSSFQMYSSGIYSDPKCSAQINHGASIVGYANDQPSNTPYYIMRNQWTTSWGINGYAWMNAVMMPTTGICGICQAAVRPIV